MSDHAGLVTEDVLDELQAEYERKPDTSMAVTTKPRLMALITAARIVPVLMAERRAWMKHCLDKFFDKDNRPMDFHLSVESMRELRAAITATDAALARAGVKMGEKR